MDLSEDGYTQEGYDEHCAWWGVYILESTTGCTAEQDFRERGEGCGQKTGHILLRLFPVKSVNIKDLIGVI